VAPVITDAVSIAEVTSSPLIVAVKAQRALSPRRSPR